MNDKPKFIRKNGKIIPIGVDNKKNNSKPKSDKKPKNKVSKITKSNTGSKNSKKFKMSNNMKYLKSEYGISSSKINKIASLRGMSVSDKMSSDELGELEGHLEGAR